MKESKRAGGLDRGTQRECKSCARRRKSGFEGQCPACANDRERGKLGIAGRASEYGIDELRRALRVLNACEEAFNQDYTAEQLLQIVRMHMRSEWTIYPDRWTDRQVREALRGRPPTWNAKTEDAEYDTEVEL